MPPLQFSLFFITRNSEFSLQKDGPIFQAFIRCAAVQAPMMRPHNNLYTNNARGRGDVRGCHASVLCESA